MSPGFLPQHFFHFVHSSAALTEAATQVVVTPSPPSFTIGADEAYVESNNPDSGVAEDCKHVRCVRASLQCGSIMWVLQELGSTACGKCNALSIYSESNLTRNETLQSVLPERLFRWLKPFQKEAVTFALQREGRVLLADDMGLGSSIVHHFPTCPSQHLPQMPPQEKQLKPCKSLRCPSARR